MTIKLTTAVLVTALTGAAALAHTGATGIVGERMEGMKMMGQAVREVAPMMRGEQPYDAAAVRAAAERISMQSGSAMTDLFPEGSTQEPSEAKPEIWTEWDDFTDLADQLKVMADGLALAADNGPAMAETPAEGMMGEGAMMGGESMMGGEGMMGQSTLMTGGTMMAELTAEELGQMPADAVFTMTSQVCSACHTRFRAKDD